MLVENFQNQNAAATFFNDALSVNKVAEANLPTRIGEFRIAGYKSLTSDEEFVCCRIRVERANAITTSHEGDRYQNGGNVDPLHDEQEKLAAEYAVERKH